MRKPLYSFLIACSLLALSCSSPAKSYHKALAQAPFDVIIVPGIPYDGKSWSNNVMKAYAWDYGIRVTFIPILFDSLHAFHVDSSLNIDPSGAFIHDFIPLPQRENTLKRIMGTLGLNIQDPESE